MLRRFVSVVLPAVLAMSGLLAAPAAADRVLTPGEVSMEDADIANSLRGQYNWMGYASQPNGWPASDVYYRDQVYWGRLEPQRREYDFSAIEQGLEKAEAQGGRFGFRVMAYCPGCWMDSRPDWPRVVPRWMPKQDSGAPDWDSKRFLSAWEDLMVRLGRRYADDPRLGWIDVGGYGSWGEWHVSGSTTRISRSGARRVIKAVVDNFPRTHVVMNAMDPEYTRMALEISPRMGLRVDCLGEFNMFSLIPTGPWMQEVWKKAPVLTEWCGTWETSPTLGAEQVQQWHLSNVSSGNLKIPHTEMTPEEQAGFEQAVRTAGYRYSVRRLRVPDRFVNGTRHRLRMTVHNAGSAPTYDRWRVALQLRKDGRVVAQRPVRVNLRRALPGDRTFTPRVRFDGVAPGRYELAVTVRDRCGYLDPMGLANVGRTPGGSYPMGEVSVR